MNAKVGNVLNSKGTGEYYLVTEIKQNTHTVTVSVVRFDGVRGYLTVDDLEKYIVHNTMSDFMNDNIRSTEEFEVTK